MAKAKLSDVADRAKVSKSTASQYMNGRFGYMSQKTKDRIALAIEELNYVPNFAARSLKTDKTKLIGVIVRDIAGYHTGDVIRGIDDYCKTQGYNVLVHNTDFDPEVEAASLQTLDNLNVDGIIIASSGENEELISDYISTGMSIVHVQLEHDHKASNLVVSDNKYAALEATEYLIQLGHERICFLSQGFASVASRRDRYEGYLEAHHRNNIEPDRKLLQYWNRDKGFKHSLSSLLSSSSPPTAFFSQHLAITIALLTFLEQEKLSIPDDISVIGFDEVPLADFLKVPITVVKQDPYAIGSKAAHMLVKGINGTLKPEKIIVPCKLVKRKSCRSV